MFLETAEYLTDMFSVVVHVVGVDQDVIKVNDNTHIDQVHKNFVNKLLPCGGSVAKSEGNDLKFK